MSREWTCQRAGCTNGGTQSRGTLKKWCSEACRKRQYDLVCADCGGRASGTDSRAVDVIRCVSCHRARLHAERHWTAEAVIDWIREHADEHGAPSCPNPVMSAAQREFGSWNAAVSAAGFPPRGHGEPRDPESWIKNLRAAAEARSSDVAERDQVMSQMWREGVPRSVIANRLSLTPEAVSLRVHHLRQKGHVLPRRNRWGREVGT